jgi:hypothetical protein
MEPYFRNEGMAMRICPVRQRTGSSDAIDETIMAKCLMNINNTDDFHKEPCFGFKLRNLNNMNVFYDEVHRRLMMNYRSLYTNYAAYYLSDEKDKKYSASILDTMNKYISYKQFPMPYELEYRIARIYKEAGAKDRAQEWADIALKSCIAIIENPNLQPEAKAFGAYSPHRIAASMYEIKGDFASAKQALQQLLGNLKQAMESIKNNPSPNREEGQKILYTIYDVQANIDEYDVDELEAQGKVTEAIAKGESILKQYEQSNDPNLKYFGRYVQNKIIEIKKKHNMKVDTAESNKIQADIN